ncbi:MAG: cytidylate kinase-like family protein [Chloroflexi bacterium]|nr:MAG: cytidylate kinase-like family protein [Chloroflexota bacterium]
MGIITISRQFGSGGDEIARQICRQLGYGLFDKRLLVRTAKELGISTGELIDYSVDDYRTRHLLERLIVGWRSPFALSDADALADFVNDLRPDTARLDQEQYTTLIQLAIQTAMEQDNFVIVGRGGQAFLKDIPGVLHVRVVAQFPDRVRRVQQRTRLEEAAAQDMVTTRDKASAEYLRRIYNIDWADPHHYHLVLNTSLLSINAAAQVVITALHQLPTPNPGP